MTLKLLDLYNIAATQEWSMYDNDAASKDELEKSLVLALNKAVSEILYSYPFSFRERTHIILTLKGVDTYELPNGLIKKDKFGNYQVRMGMSYLNLLEEANCLSKESGAPSGFYLKNGQIVLYPKPAEKMIITVDYYTLSIGENAEGEEIYTLDNPDDTITVPLYLEELLKNAIIARAMLNSIASETDENYSAYKKQSETAYRLLIKYSKGVGLDKTVKI